jgi:sporulation protein YlmC with PRC-barrel domain
MRHTVKQLRGDDIVARDGSIGTVKDVYFDDERWAVRYLVVDTGTWLPGRRVLVSPAAVEGVDEQDVHVRLTREQVKGAPDVESDRPVSRQQEMAHAAHFGYPYYWSGPLLWGAAAYPIHPLAAKPALSPSQVEAERAAQQQLEQGDSHLRSGAEVIGYRIEARDGAIGEVEDFVVDEETWAIAGMVVDTRKWWPGGEVQVSPALVSDIDWGARTVRLHVTRDELRRAAAL